MADEAEKDLLDKINIQTKKIKFVPSYNDERVETFRVTNPTDRVVTMKVKSTRLKMLNSKPSYAMIQPQRGIYINVKFRKLGGSTFDLRPDRLTFYFGIVPSDKTSMKASKLWKTAAPKITRRHPIEIEYDPKIEGTPPAGVAPIKVPATGAPQKRDDDDEGEEAEDEDSEGE